MPADLLAKSVSFLTDDSVHIRGSLYDARDDGAVSLLLLHDAGADRSFWDAYVPLFRSRGWSVLTFDLRGHGESLRQDMRSALLAPDIMHLTSQHAYPSDVRAAIAFLGRQPKGDARRIAAVGVGLGGDLAYAAAGRGWGTRSTVCIGVDEFRARQLAGQGGFTPRNIYTMYSEGDAAAATSAAAVGAASLAPSEVKPYPGTSNGPALWNERQPEILARAIAWIERTI